MHRFKGRSLGVEDFARKHCKPTPEDLTLKVFEPFVCVYFELTPDELYERTRRRGRSRPRQVLMYLAATHGKQSLPDIGKRMGDLDHTTVMYGRDRIRDLLEKGVENQETMAVRAIEEHFKERHFL